MGLEATVPPVDVAVVGAGLAGLTAARAVQRAGRSVVVVEARDEVGGRACSRELDGQMVDFGGEWIGRAHRRMHRLVRDLGLDVEPAANLGRPVRWRLPDRSTTGRLPPPRTWPGLARAIGRAAWQSRGIDPEAPWTARRAAELDNRSVAGWLDDLGLDAEARYLLERLIGSLACQALDSMSLLHLLWLLRIAGGPVRSMNATFQWRIRQGAQQVARRLAEPLAVVLNTPIERISQDGATAAIHATELSVRAGRVIVAVPVTQLPTISFDPPLPGDLQRLPDLHIGPGTKVIALLPQGHSVRHNTVLGGGTLWGGWRRGDRVSGFVPPAGADAHDDALVADLASAFDVRPDQLRSPTVMRWADERHIGGCDAVFAPGQVCALGPLLAQPHGLLEFAGAERSSWPDNMEGAVRSGERAARRTLAALKDSRLSTTPRS
ncbi:FAD-dependent oxidoreductase [Mycolicibacter terrae]|uniref:FAD-dependent oxidoreductase n=1 Tax=Mycolicibacter terrae TaxID=1788 RepID=A0ACD2EHH8_9MYCO|nr:FAD-dependent oxidoreductase [Mycolicibacter terrae]